MKTEQDTSRNSKIQKPSITETSDVIETQETNAEPLVKKLQLKLSSPTFASQTPHQEQAHIGSAKNVTKETPKKSTIVLLIGIGAIAILVAAGAYKVYFFPENQITSLEQPLSRPISHLNDSKTKAAPLVSEVTTPVPSTHNTFETAKQEQSETLKAQNPEVILVGKEEFNRLFKEEMEMQTDLLPQHPDNHLDLVLIDNVLNHESAYKLFFTDPHLIATTSAPKNDSDLIMSKAEIYSLPVGASTITPQTTTDIALTTKDIETTAETKVEAKHEPLSLSTAPAELNHIEVASASSDQPTNLSKNEIAHYSLPVEASTITPQTTTDIALTTKDIETIAETKVEAKHEPLPLPTAPAELNHIEVASASSDQPTNLSKNEIAHYSLPVEASTITPQTTTDIALTTKDIETIAETKVEAKHEPLPLPTAPAELNHIEVASASSDQPTNLSKNEIAHTSPNTQQIPTSKESPTASSIPTGSIIPESNPEIKDFLNRMHVSSIIPIDQRSKMTIGGRIYSLKESINPDLGIKWSGIDAKKRILYFKDNNDIQYSKKF